MATGDDASAMDQGTEFLTALQDQLDLQFRPRVVLPGEDVTNEVSRHGEQVLLGNGLVHGAEGVRVSKAGLLRYQGPNTYRIDSYQRRYIPKAEDSVLGVIEDRQAEAYRVNIYGSVPGLLPHLAFEGATKRNKPNLKVGALVYCRVAVANKDMDPELSCVSTHGVKKDWMTGQSTFRELKDGIVTRCSIRLCTQLLDRDCSVLHCLKTAGVGFEVAIGLNGVFWVRAQDNRTTVAVSNSILNSEMIKSAADMAAMVEVVLHSAKLEDPM